MAARMSLGEVLVIPQGEWQFHVATAAGVAVGRRLPIGGILRVRAEHHGGTTPATGHDACLARAAGHARCGCVRAFDHVQLTTASGPFGSASYHRGRDLVCVWYCWRPSGLIFGAYSCAWANRTRREYRHAMGECESMMLSAVFDRSQWGASDPLTKALEEDGPATSSPP